MASRSAAPLNVTGNHPRGDGEKTEGRKEEIMETDRPTASLGPTPKGGIWRRRRAGVLRRAKRGVSAIELICTFCRKLGEIVRVPHFFAVSKQ